MLTVRCPLIDVDVGDQALTGKLSVGHVDYKTSQALAQGLDAGQVLSVL